MAIYKVQGPNGEIITIEGPDGADPNDVIAQAQSLYKPKERTTTDYAKDFGKATASLADTGINAVTGMLDYAAYPLARAFGRTPEQATQETSSPKDVIGRAFGITQDPAYQSETSRRMMAGLGEGVEKYAVKPLTSATGLPEQDVSSMVNTAMLGAGVKAQPYINRAGQSVAQGIYNAEPYVTGAAKTAVTAPYQFGKGVIEGLVNKEYNPATSAMVPLRDTYTPPAAAQRFMGQLPGVPEQSLAQLQSQARPTSELVGGTAGRVAQAISPKTLAGETLVPLQGQGMQAFGERVGRGVRTNPLQAMGEVGLTALTGIPFKTLAQGVGELGARYLGAKTGFMPGFSEKVGQAQKTAAQQQAFTPPPSSGGYTPPPGGYGGPPPPPGGGNRPISPSQIPPVTPAEISKQAALQRVQGQMSQQQGLTNPVSADFMSTVRETRPQYQTPQQMAIQKTQEIVAQQAPVQQAPVQQAPVQQAPVQQAPVQQAPVQQAPVATTPVVRTAPAPVEDILGKTRQITKEESKANAKQVRANKKAKAEGKTVTKEPIHPEVERITKEAEPLTQDYIKSLDLDNKTLVEKDAIKQSLITEESKLKSAISNNRITKALNNDEVEALMKRFHAVSKARDVIQNEQVRINSLKERVKKLTEMVEYNKNRPKGRVARELGSGRTAEADLPIYQKQLDDILAKQPKTLEEKVDVVKSQGEARRNQARGKPDVSEMKIGKEELPTGIKSLSKETTGEIYPSKDAYDKAMTFKILQEDVPRASYIEGDKLITVFPQNIPKEIIRSTGISPTATIIRDAKTGKVIKD
jgi:hypothetical protein